MKYKSGLVVAFLILGLSCEKGNPVLSEDVVFALSASPRTLLNLGDTSIIRVVVSQADGRPVLDGARIQFSATAGSITPEARTEDGIAQAVFTSDAEAGAVTITVRSGTVGADGTASLELEVLDREQQIAVLGLSANPNNLNRAGGRVSLLLTVLDAAGEPVSGRKVFFSSTYGNLSSNGAPLTTNELGQVYEQLSLTNIPADLAEVSVTAQVGGVSAEAKITITENQTPVAAFSSSPQSLRKGEPVFFNAGSSADSDGDIVQYQWDFGDGTTAQGVTPTHIFNQSRVFTVSLSVTDDQGATALTSTSLTVGENQAPQAQISFDPPDPRINEPIVFNGGSSSDSDGQIVQWQWDMGNGVVRTGATTAFAYSRSGSYIVALTVTDNEGATNATLATVNVSGNLGPVADFVVSPESPLVDEPVLFDASSAYDEDGTITAYEWDFGDGDRANGISVSHVYSQAGVYRVNLKVLDSDGSLGFAAQTVAISDGDSPQAQFTFVPSDPLTLESVVFDGSGSSDADGQIRGYHWDFGDGATGSGAVVQHRFVAAGNYPVTLKVQDNEGKPGTHTEVVTVSVGRAPTASLVVEPSSLAIPRTTLILDASASSDNEDNVDQLKFEFSATHASHISVGIDQDGDALATALVDNVVAGDRVTFQVAVTDRQGNTSFETLTAEAGAASSNQAPVAVLVLEPASVTLPGGVIALDGTGSSDADHDVGVLDYAFGVFTTGNTAVLLSGNGPVRRAEISQAQAGDTVTFFLTVTDPLGAQSTVYERLILATP